MAVAPLIAMKSTACVSLEAVGMELDRRAHTYENDVDQSRSHLNVNYIVRPGDARPLPLEQAVERRMGELNTKRKIRDNQVRAMGFIVSTNDALDDEQAHAFLNESMKWFADRYGWENLLAAAEHYDEGTAHIQFWIAPVIHDAETGYDRLCAKELFAPDKTRKNPQTGKREVVAKGTMSMLQDDFWREVASKYGYERPLPKELRQKGYRSLEAYKQHEGTTRELKAEITALKDERDCLDEAIAKRGGQLRGLEEDIAHRHGVLYEVANGIADKKAELSELDRIAAETRAEIERETARLESLRLRTGAFEKDVEQLGAVHALVRDYEVATRGRKGEILSQIADCCIAVRDGVEARWRAVREAVGRILRPVQKAPTTAGIREALRRREGVVDLKGEVETMRAAAEAMDTGSRTVVGPRHRSR